VLPWQAHGDEFANFIVRPRNGFTEKAHSGTPLKGPERPWVTPSLLLKIKPITAFSSGLGSRGTKQNIRLYAVPRVKLKCATHFTHHM
jgi:hypothetical protein